MRNATRRLKIRWQHKSVLGHVVVTLAAVLLAEGAVLGVGAWIARRSAFVPLAWGLHVVLVALVAALAGLLLGAWASRHTARRVQRALEVARAWLRGNLSLRIADPSGDELGMLAEQLDLLAEHLGQDEQDLGELREYTTRLSDQIRALAVDEERDRLARELHDGVKQHLFSLAMTASAIRTHVDGQQDVSPDLAEMVHEVETTAKTVQRELTRLIENLRPGSLEEKGLAAALNDYTLLFGAREHILVYLDVQGNDALLAPSVAESLYRVAQEALHNVARHARATRVDVRLRCLPEQATLTLCDNGVGFDTGQAHHGLGLENMQDRMMTVGGRLTIDSEIGVGTTVRAEVALTRPLDLQTEIARLDKERPDPTIDNWAWLGQRLVIPVGQTWPWLPADQAHLRQPLVASDGGPLAVKRDTGFLRLKRAYLLQRDAGGMSWVRVRRHRSGYKWKSEGATWALLPIRGPNSRMALTRNGQPLAAMQSQGRLLNAWTEIIYDGRGYRLSQVRGRPDSYVLVDRADEELLSVEGGAVIKLCRVLPLPLLAMVAMRVLDQVSATTGVVNAVEMIQ
jgi:signal transduction histidine kinase